MYLQEATAHFCNMTAKVFYRQAPPAASQVLSMLRHEKSTLDSRLPNQIARSPRQVPHPSSRLVPTTEEHQTNP